MCLILTHLFWIGHYHRPAAVNYRGKYIQWNGMVMGGLHIEMNILNLLGDWLAGGGWTTALVKAVFTTSGLEDAILKSFRVTSARYVHQTTAAASHLLQFSANNEYTNSFAGDKVLLEFTRSCKVRSDQCPQFMYWSMVLDLELLLMQQVWSFREADFRLYVQCLGQLVPWMFSLDHITMPDGTRAHSGYGTVAENP